MMHESGTGGNAKYGIVSQMPLTSIAEPVNLLDNRTYWQPRVGNDTASVGYYKTSLKSGVDIEIAGARHVGLMQYSFPKGSGKHILVDVSHYLPSEAGGYDDQYFIGGQISINRSQYTGSGSYIGGFNEGAPYKVYFCGEFEDEPDQAKTFKGKNTDPIPRYHTFADGSVPQAVFSSSHSEASGPMNDRVGAVFSWNSTAATVKSKVAVSFISTEKACQYIDAEIPSWNLQDSVDDAVQEWNTDVFSKVQVPTASSANMTNVALLYTSMYFVHLMPSDRSGENPLWDSDEPYWDDFYTLWDIFRCTVSLYHLIQPTRYEGIIRALIDIWRNEGYMPDGR
jgi:putative alpha-1,2-mannosidase